MTPELLQLLNDTGGGLINKIRDNLAATGTSATGKTAQSLRYTITDGGQTVKLEIMGRPFFATVETGRKATPDQKPGRNMIANIREWVKARGMPENLVWAIATSIQKKGTKLHQAGGRTDIYSNVVSDPTFIEQLSQEILKTFAAEYAKQVKVNFT